MALMVVAEHGDMVLTYDTDDVEKVTLATPRDVIDTTGPEDTAVRRELGQAHLDLHISFLPGKSARWIHRGGQ